LAEFRRLREIARLLPGPDAPNPRDKIWDYLIAEYGFDPPTLWRMSHRDMRRYIEARPPDRRKAEPAPAEVMEPTWITYAEAANILNGDPSMISRYVKGGKLHSNGLQRKRIRVSKESVGLLKAELDAPGPKRRAGTAKLKDDHAATLNSDANPE